MWLAVALSAACVVAGIVVVYTMGSLLGPLLIIGGVMALGVAMLPDVVDRFVRLLSVGTLRRK